VQDNDDAKNHALRLEYDLLPKLQLGVNEALTKIEIKMQVCLEQIFLINANYLNFGKPVLIQNSNTEPMFLHFTAATLAGKDVSDYKMTGFYIIPFISRTINESNKSFVEFTCRYEYLEDVNKNGNVGRFYTQC
jgi:hypothetical protein